MNRTSNIILIWCLALVIAGYVGHRATRLFSNTDGSVAGSTSAQAHHIISCLDLQRYLNSINPKFKLVEDGICGPATMAAWNEVVFNGYAIEFMD